MPKKLLLFPFGGNARESLLSVFAINEIRKEWDILGFIDDDQSQHGKDCCGIKVLGGRAILDKMPEAFVLAVPGSPTSYLRRKDIIASLHAETSRFATIIHPSVVIAPDAIIGYNTIIMPNVVISCGVRIGSHCILLPNSVVSHDSIVDDYCCLGSNISISGSVRIGSSCYIGSGTKMRENVSIGEGTLIGLGSTVISDIQAGVIAAGCPAKVFKKVTS
jgi:sugar O-acyltransferase (sialic acid O-acetyltransferase NeuD family)